MLTQTKDDSIKICCTSEWKHKIKQLSLYSDKSISNYIIDLVDQQLKNELNPLIDNNEITQSINQLELLTVTLLQGIYQFNHQQAIFEEICSEIYRKKEINHE